MKRLLLTLSCLFVCGCGKTIANSAHDWLGAQGATDHSWAVVTTSESELRPIDHISSGPDFHLTIGIGSGLSGLNILDIGGDKAAKLILKTPTFEKATFTLSDSELDDLISVLNKCSAGRWDRVYGTRNVEDGSQWVIWIRTAGQEKTTYCDNHFPVAVQRVVGWANRLLDQKVDAFHPIDRATWSEENQAVWGHLKQ